MPGLKTAIVKRLLTLFPAYPTEEYLGTYWINGEVATRRAAGEFEDEQAGGLLKFFTDLNEPGRPGPARILDLGSGFGGRAVAFQHHFRCEVLGLEIDPRMAAWGHQFSQSNDAAGVLFVAGVGEAIPLS